MIGTCKFLGIGKSELLAYLTLASRVAILFIPVPGNFADLHILRAIRMFHMQSTVYISFKNLKLN